MQGDADGNGAVDGADYLAWQQQFGTTPAAPSAGAVPEPASLLLIGLAAGGFAVRRWR
jgi:hypothetical protein